MAELPSSWGLKTQKRDDGKLDILGKDDTGHEYRVRTTDSPEVSERDVQELKAADRESYGNPETRTYDFVKKLTEPGNRKKAEDEARYMDDLTYAAEPVCHAGFERGSLTVGSTAAYRKNYDKVFGGN